MAELNLTTATIVTRQDEDRIEIDAGRIDAIPAWRFLLDVGANQSTISASHECAAAQRRPTSADS